MDFTFFLKVVLNSLTLAALYFIVAAGFTLVFGLMRVLNLAHGAIYLFGAYVGFDVMKANPAANPSMFLKVSSVFHLYFFYCSNSKWNCSGTDIVFF